MNYQSAEKEFRFRYREWMKDSGVPSLHLCWYLYLESLYENGIISEEQFQLWKEKLPRG